MSHASRPPPVVPAAWVLDQVEGGEPIVLADVRWYLDGRSGRAAYEAEHVAGAVFVDLDACLAGPPSPAAGRHPLPTPEDFAAGLAAAGIGDGDTVIAYDDAGGAVAARLVWLLRATGRPAALLDGGLAAWPGERRGGHERRPAATLAVVPWPPDLLAGADDLTAPAEAVVVDARAPERYRGEVEPVDPRAGHVPGAVNVPVADTLEPEGRTFRDPTALRERFAAAGVDAGTRVIAYCGSGVNACHVLLALEHAGLGPGRLYPGSWSQWSADPDRPAATGDEP